FGLRTQQDSSALPYTTLFRSVVVDDAHGDFVFGSTGSYSGVSTHLGVDDLVDIHVSSLSKALGCFGGYVATTSILKEFLVNKSRSEEHTSELQSRVELVCRLL